MDATTEQLILTEIQGVRGELRDFRSEVQTWQQEAGERVAQLEVKARDICGNGQPGRMWISEQAIAVLQRFRYWQLGMAAGVSGVVTVVGWAVIRLTK
jgi:hypothetical protein